MISIDAEKGTIDLEVDAAEMDKRRKAWKAPPNMYQSGALRKFADQVGPARYGAVTHAGGKAEVHCYADI
jgi:dihydroxy-acid dehydratase